MFESEYKSIKSMLDGKLREYISGAPVRLQKSIEYSLFGDGKRLRPVLLLSVLKAYGKAAGDAEYMLAAAVECIHTYSLIHDDLPALDNDDYRRGKLTNHKVFGEPAALLAGDALLNFAYELILSSVKIKPEYIDAGIIIAKHAGVTGMIGGQATEFENDILSAGEALLLDIYDKKCGRLISAAVLAGAKVCGCPDSDYKLWETFGDEFGLCFQLKDDLLDEQSQAGYGTLLNLWGRDKTAAELSRRTDKILAALVGINADTRFISLLSGKILGRAQEGL